MTVRTGFRAWISAAIVMAAVAPLPGAASAGPTDHRYEQHADPTGTAVAERVAGRNGLIAGWTRDDQNRARIMLLDPDTLEHDLVPPVDLEDPYPYGYMDWTPDGRQITIVDRNSSTGRSVDIVNVDVKTGEVDRILELPPALISHVGQLSWSPSGDQIVFDYVPTTYPPGEPHTARIAIGTPATGEFVDLMAGTMPDWSPTGERIAFIGPDAVPGEYGNSGDLWVIGMDGSGARNISQSDASISFPDWSPDGKRIVTSLAANPRNGFFYGITIFSADTGAAHKVSIFSGDHTWTRWSPDGRGILYHYFDVHAPQFPPEIVIKTLGTNGARVVHTGGDFAVRAWQTDPGCLLDDSFAQRERADGGAIEVGRWVAQGCFTKAGERRRTKDPVLLSGLTLTPLDGSIVIDTDRMRLSSTGTVEVAVEGGAAGMRIGPVKLHRGRLDWDLGAGTLPFEIDHFLELPVRKKVVVSARGEGRSKLSVQLIFPQILDGAGLEAQVFTLSNAEGLNPNQLQLSLPSSIPVTDFVRLGNARVTYDPTEKTWTPSATLAGSDLSVDVGFRHEKGVLKEAHLRIPALDLAGLVKLTDISITFDRRRSDQKKELETYAFRASAPVGDEGLSDTFSGMLRYSDGDLDAYELTAGLAHVFGVVKAQDLRLAWSREDGWSGGAGAVLQEGAGTAAMAIELRSVKHRVVGGAIRAPLLRLGPQGGFQLENLTVAYDELPKEGGGVQTRWTGGAKVRLPGPQAPAVGASLTFVDGEFAGGSLDLENVRLGGPITLSAGRLDMFLRPLSLSGTLTVMLAPEVPVLGAATATLSAAYAQAAKVGDPDVYTFGGNLSIGNALLVGSSVQYLTTDVLTANGLFNWKVADLSVADASVKGTFESKGYLVQGAASVGMGNVRLPGRVKATRVGIAACIGLPKTPLSVGFGYRWNGTVHRLGAACDMDAFLEPARSVLAQRRNSTTVQLPAGAEVIVLELVGLSGSPEGLLRGPDGTRVDLGAEDGFQGDALVYRDAAAHTVYVALPEPAGGAWVVDTEGGTHLAELRTSTPLPAPEMDVSAVHDASGWVLHHQLVAAPGQEVTVSEVVDGVEHPIAAFTTDGETRFHPAAGPAGPRTLVATVFQDGLVRTSMEVASYDAPEVSGCTALEPCATEVSARKRLRGSRLVVSGRVGPDVTAGPVLVALTHRGEWVASRVVELGVRPFRVGFRLRREPVPCRVTVTYPGDAGHTGSTEMLRARC